MYTWEPGITANVLECFYGKERIGRIVKLGEVWQVIVGGGFAKLGNDVIAMKRDREEAKRFLQDYWSGGLQDVVR